MNRNIKSLIGFTLHATDGEIGHVKEFYFDDDTWTLRYIIVDTGNWLSGRVVLIAPEALLSPDWEHKTFPINLTKEQIKNSPDINTNKPVCRQEEAKLYSYYSWMAYWGKGYYGMGPTDGLKQDELERSVVNEDVQLRSTDKVTGYSIQATNGHIGSVEDFLMNDTHWKIEFMLVNTGHWLPGKKVVLSIDLIKKIDWKTATVTVGTTVARVRNSPEYDPNHEMTEVYTLALRDHYNI